MWCEVEIETNKEELGDSIQYQQYVHEDELNSVHLALLDPQHPLLDQDLVIEDLRVGNELNGFCTHFCTNVLWNCLYNEFADSGYDSVRHESRNDFCNGSLMEQ